MQLMTSDNLRKRLNEILNSLKMFYFKLWQYQDAQRKMSSKKGK